MKKINLKSPRVKTILKKTLLYFLLANALLIVVGLFFPMSRASAEGNITSNKIVEGDLSSLLELDKSRDYQPISVSEAKVSTLENVSGYGSRGLVHKWEKYPEQETLVFEINVPEGDPEGEYYELALDYKSLQKSVTNISLNIQWNDDENLKEENVVLATAWTDATDEATYDLYNNQVTGTQEALEVWKHVFLYDQLYYGLTPLRFKLKSGLNTLKITKNQGELYLGNIYLVKAGSAPLYQSVTSTAGAKDKCITLEGEKPLFKSDASISSSSVQNPTLFPYDTKYNKLNVLSGDSFNKSGYTVTYAFEVEETGYYEFTLRYANTQSNTYSYVDILLDNQSYYEELTRYPFAASSKYVNETLSAKNGEAMRFFLEEGKHTLTLRIDASVQSEIYDRMFKIINEINTLYLEILKLTGGEVDNDRIWDNIDIYFADDNKVSDRLNHWVQELKDIEALIDEVSKVNPEKDNTLAQYVNNARNKLEKIAKYPDEVPHELANLCTGSASVAALLSNSLHTSTFSPVSVDRIYVHTSDYRVKKHSGNFFLTYFSIVQRIVRSGVNANDSEETLTVWVNRATYYVSSLQKYADANYDGKVRFSLMPDESKLTYSYAAGTQPDVALGVSASIPYDLGLRGALLDLTQFDDAKVAAYNSAYKTGEKAIKVRSFGETIADFAPGSLTGLGYSEGTPNNKGEIEFDQKIYGIPETQDFQILFYRKDILEKVLREEVPNTWNDVIEMLPSLQRNGMNFYIPMAGGSGMKSISSTAPFIFQYGADLYTEDAMASGIDSENGMLAVNLMVDLFQLYSLPLTGQNFFNSFRTGTLPIGVAGFDMYLQLVNAAPEIAGKWDVALVPGVKHEDGSADQYPDKIRRDVCADVRTCVIFKGTGNEDRAWDFLSWWLSEETQVNYANQIQTTYGSTFLWNTANMKAFKTLAIEQNVIDTVVLAQNNYLHNVSPIPATYIVERSLSNIWNSAVFEYESVRALVTDKTIEMNKEITRKYQEFGYVDSDGNPSTNKQYRVLSVEEIKAIQNKGGNA